MGSADAVNLAKFGSLPNIITICRLVLVPVIVSMIVDGEWRNAFVVFLVAGASDAADGREVATDNVLILHDYVVLDDGETAKDAEVAVLLRGIAKGGKVILEDGTEASAAIKAALRSAISDVIFEVGTAGDPA